MEPSVPSSSPVLAELLAISARTDVTATKLERALAPTPELSHGLIRLAQSFGRRGRTGTLEEAFGELSGRGVHALIACLGAKKVLSVGHVRWLALDDFWLASLRRAAAALTIARLRRLSGELDLFAVGFLCDVGLIVRVHTDPAATLMLAEVASEVAAKRLRAEQKCGGPSHDELGLRLCRRWSLPARIAVPIRYHHEPQNAPVAYQSAAFAVRAAEAIADMFSSQDARLALVLAESALGAAGIDTNRLGEIVDATADLVDDIGSAFGLDPLPEARFDELSGRAVAMRTSQVRETDAPEDLRQQNERLIRENRALRQRLKRLEARIGRGSILPEPRASFVDDLGPKNNSTMPPHERLSSYRPPYVARLSSHAPTHSGLTPLDEPATPREERPFERSGRG
jgi:HD-like signal output (HDOD) protein